MCGTSDKEGNTHVTKSEHADCPLDNFILLYSALQTINNSKLNF